MKIVLLVSCLLAVVSSPISAATSPVAHFDDPVFGFTVDLPSLGDPTDALLVQRLVVMGPAVDGFAPNCNVQIQYTAMGLDAYLELTRKQFSEHGAVLAAEKRRTTSGLPSTVIEYTLSSSGGPLRHISLAVAASERVWLLTCTALDASFSQHRSAFEHILESFTVKQEAPAQRK